MRVGRALRAITLEIRRFILENLINSVLWIPGSQAGSELTNLSRSGAGDEVDRPKGRRLGTGRLS